MNLFARKPVHLPVLSFLSQESIAFFVSVKRPNQAFVSIEGQNDVSVKVTSWSSIRLQLTDFSVSFKAQVMHIAQSERLNMTFAPVYFANLRH
jgi:hypothetical protein